MTIKPTTTPGALALPISIKADGEFNIYTQADGSTASLLAIVETLNATHVWAKNAVGELDGVLRQVHTLRGSLNAAITRAERAEAALAAIIGTTTGRHPTIESVDRIARAALAAAERTEK